MQRTLAAAWQRGLAYLQVAAAPLAVWFVPELPHDPFPLEPSHGSPVPAATPEIPIEIAPAKGHSPTRFCSKMQRFVYQLHGELHEGLDGLRVVLLDRDPVVRCRGIRAI